MVDCEVLSAGTVSDKSFVQKMHMERSIGFFGVLHTGTVTLVPPITKNARDNPKLPLAQIAPQPGSHALGKPELARRGRMDSSPSVRNASCKVNCCLSNRMNCDVDEISRSHQRLDYCLFGGMCATSHHYARAIPLQAMCNKGHE